MLFFPFIVGLAGLVVAQNPSPSTATETLAQRCVTQSGPTSCAVLETRTRTPSLVTRITSDFATTPTITMIPTLETDTTVVNITVTNTDTQLRSTNVLTITNTQSVTTIFTITATNIATSNVTEFEQVTTSKTILPSSGFVPIQTVIAQAGVIPGRRDEIYARAKKPAAQMSVNDDGEIVTTPRQYPVRVQCLRATLVTITRFRRVVASAETVTASASTITTTVTSFFTEGATELQADATEIITESALVAISTTATEVQSATVTQTVTESVFSTYPTPYYAACSPDNIARTIEGVPIGRMGVKNTFGTLSANTPYDCCVRGIQGDYAGTFFQKGGCFLISQAVLTSCDASEQAFTFNTVATLDLSDGIVVSNGNCGQGQVVPEPPRAGRVGVQ